MSNHPVKDFMVNMRDAGFNFEFRAISPQGHIVQSKGWQEIQYRYEINPQVTMKAKK